MTNYERRTVLGGIAAATASIAGCFETDSSGSFTRTAVENQQLVVEFTESLDVESISVVDPDGESFGETSVPAGTTRVAFDIEMPYTPGEYRILASASGDVVAETTQEIRPELEIVDVGVGANRLDEMPEELGQTKGEEAIVLVQNDGAGPEGITQLQFRGRIPNPRKLDEGRIGIFDPEKPGEANEPISLNSDSETTLYSSTLPFSFEGDGVDCSDQPQTHEMTIELQGLIVGHYSEEYQIEYTAAESYNECEITIQEVS